MSRILGALVLAWAICLKAFALTTSFPGDMDALVRIAKDIVIVECVSIPTNRPALKDGHRVVDMLGNGMYPVEINLIRTLKGDRPRGKQIIATIYPMTPGRRYLLYSLCGSVGGSGGEPAIDFLAVRKLSVVEIPPSFDLKSLDGKALKEQVQSIFSRHLFQLERQLAPLLEEQELLEKAVAGRAYEYYESDGPVKIGPIFEASTQTDRLQVYLSLGTNQLQWSRSLPGKTGFLYFEKLGAAHSPFWEFSPCSANKIEDLANQPLTAKFYGMYTPGRSAIGWQGLQSIPVSVGEVLLARTTDNPRRIFIVQIVEQDRDRERMVARYAAIQP